MVVPEFLRQIRRLHLSARRIIMTSLGGQYRSAFKGQGLAFEEVREYQPGDDIRTIDWNVTARAGTAFVKRFVEERELTILLLVDVSASLDFSSGLLTKRAVVAEIVALLTFCAMNHKDRVGLLTFSEQIEQYCPPRSGTRHGLRLVREVLATPAKLPGTNLTVALDFLNQVPHRRAIVFFISDFLSPTPEERSIRLAARKHDLIAVRVTDPNELTWPDVGLVRLQDAETGQQRLIDTHSARFRDDWSRRTVAHRAAHDQLMQRAGVDRIEMGTQGGHLEALIAFFRRREARRRRR